MHREKLKELCELASIEQDPDKLMDLVRQISELLDAEEQRMKTKSGSGGGFADLDLTASPSREYSKESIA